MMRFCALFRELKRKPNVGEHSLWFIANARPESRSVGVETTVFQPDDGFQIWLAREKQLVSAGKAIG
jgi:hypothetical protein